MTKGCRLFKYRPSRPSKIVDPALMPASSRPLWRRAFNTGERLVGRPLEEAARTPAVSVALGLGIKTQRWMMSSLEEAAAVSAPLWGLASRRDLRMMLSRLAELERAIAEVEHRVEDTTESAAMPPIDIDRKQRNARTHPG
jgi:hypothetical protein